MVKYINNKGEIYEAEYDLQIARHTSSHILAQAIKRIYGSDIKLAIGPAIDNGFYYDFDGLNVKQEDLENIENEMKKIVKENQKTSCYTLNKKEAIKLVTEMDEIYKKEMIEEMKEDEIISFFAQGDFTDMCTGPHMLYLKSVGHFKLFTATGAYWRGNEKNKMLTRIYGTCFEKKEELESEILKKEEAKDKDHNKLGREMELFTTVDMIGQGLPILLPKGATIVQTLQRFVEDEERKRGYLLTKTPFMAKSDLYKVSGHWDHYKEGMFILGDEAKDKEVFALRPMTCPFQFMAYKNRQRSYRDLPLRYNETSTLFRNEDSGEMHGLIRVRQFTISEGHLAVRLDQLEKEIAGVLDLINYFMDVLGLKEDISFRFSKWDPNDRAKYLGNEEDWEYSQSVLKSILDDLKINYVEAIGEAAFYGPKLDIQAKNVYGKEDTIITVQVDFQLAHRFEMTYIDKDGSKKYPVVIHRTSIGCYERTLAMLIEKYAGTFPLWLVPIQAKILTISENEIEYAEEVKNKLLQADFKVELDSEDNKIGYKIREAQLEKVPYMIVIGKNEVENNTITIRNRNGEDIKDITVDEFINMLNSQVKKELLK
ncbi:MAG: threonine--tRNA ligase [Clostridia bacterium]